MRLPSGGATAWVSRHALAAALLAAAFVLFLTAILIGLPENEGARALITLATGLLLGGVLKIVMDNHADAKKRLEDDQKADKLARDEAAKRFDALIADMHHNRDRLETTRLLIAAHRSAKTYGERMRDVIDAHVVLLKIARLPGMGVVEPDDDDVARLENMLAYLVALQDEYRDNYKTVSNLQRYDEEVTRQQLVAHAKRLLDDGDEADPPPASRRAWKLLHDAGTFPVLNDLCHKGPEYRTCFLGCCSALSDKLANARATGRLLPASTQGPRPDSTLSHNVQVKADAIRERCGASSGELPDPAEVVDGSVRA